MLAEEAPVVEGFVYEFHDLIDAGQPAYRVEAPFEGNLLAARDQPQQPVVKVDRKRERAIFRQIKAQNRRKIGDLSRICNAELAEKGR